MNAARKKVINDSSASVELLDIVVHHLKSLPDVAPKPPLVPKLPRLKDNVRHAIEKIRDAEAALKALKPEELVTPEVQDATFDFKKAAEPFTIVPSEFWSRRKTGRKENPVAFVQRVYAKELAAGTIDRAALRAIDLSLAEALDTWISRHPEHKAVFSTQDKPRRSPLSGAERTARYRARRM